ncbi:MAG: 2-oxoacid:acceptor oxidoreductase family protein, partial [Desulforhabdus sp.]|nr:2-oxoacid:acceptor oxidoreductase family protein [Desulforhabdus sp.]
ETGILITDHDLVQPAERKDVDFFSIPATRFAEEMGRKMMANIVMLGFLAAVTGTVSVDSARNTVEHSVPKGTEQMNLKAFNKGFEFGLATLKGRKKKAAGMKGVAA